MIWIAAISSLAYAAFTAVSAVAAIHLLSLVVGFLLGYWRQQTWLWYALSAFLAVNIAIALFVAELPYGLLGNPNYLGVCIAIGLAGAMAYRIWPFVPVALIGLWWCQSRTAWIGAAIVGFLSLYRRWPATACVTALLCILAGVLVIKGEGSIAQRLGIWQMALTNMTLWGHGWGGFLAGIDALPVKINLTAMKTTGAYNDYIQLIFELGLGAIPLLVFVAICLEGTEHKSRLIWWTYFAMSFTYFPLWVPGVGFFVFMALGRMAASRNEERKPSWHVGDLSKATI